MPPRNLNARSTTSSSARILLVDDNADGLSARKCVLEELGHRISTAIGGTEALEQFAPDKFDVVVTDYKMPSMNGKELIRRLRKLQPDLPVIMISGFSDTLGLDEKSTGADTVIQKSNNEVSHLVRAVVRLLKRKPVAKFQVTKKPMAAAAGASSQTGAIGGKR